ncbi:hypothetical protein J3L14_07105 [Burkholderia pseudomallei]|uniref:hypothetical protein n=1 Tax=Burkholderia pseudomallei TaxID=28450 RepID=UPI001A9D6DA2|nr:hypothetical protein [Burkholderia pseudomallei]MBO7933708.1 hypothetical protein [Burkholderia pseudomallei]QTB80637.1 hypothetical protein J3L14_07105 [Burkholderia pseudomallei]
MDKAGRVSAGGEQPETPVSDGELLRRLRERAADCQQKSMTARLAAVLDLVEEILHRGYDRSQVREILTGSAWRFTADSFDSALSRLRKRRAAPASEHGLVDESNSRTTIDTRATQDSEVRPTSLADSFLERTRSGGGRKWR